ncbi:MAG: hypothetical protein U0U09_02920 [Cyclobacteriaceae bacterium]
MTEAPGAFIYSEELYSLPGRTLVLIPVPWVELPEGDVALLEKILSAARLSLAGSQIICAKKASLSDFKSYNPSLIISFGVPLQPETEHYQAKTEGNVTIIRSDSLGELDDVRKKNLWAALKQLLSR